MEKLRLNWRSYAVGFLSVVAIILWAFIYSNRDKDFVEVSFLDVGEGDATLIQGLKGTRILIDAGRDKSVLRELGETLPLFDRSLDMVVALYPDKDNTGGLPFVFEQYDVAKFIASDDKTNSALEEVQRAVEEKHIQKINPHKGMSIHLGDGSKLIVLSPKGAPLVMKYIFEETCFLFMGGASQKDEHTIILDSSETVNCQVLKIGHHGSKNSTSDNLLTAVRPLYAVFSNGKDNQYEYPHQEVLDRLKNFGVTPLNTMNEGRVTFISDGKTVTLKK